MIIRRGLVSDSNAIAQLLMQLGYPQVGNGAEEAIAGYGNESYHLLVVELENVVVGFASLHWFDMFHSRGKIGRVTAICILEKFRSQGIGKKLLSACEEFLMDKGCTKVEITTNIKRTLTHEFYQQNGYTIDSKRFIKIFG